VQLNLTNRGRAEAVGIVWAWATAHSAMAIHIVKAMDFKLPLCIRASSFVRYMDFSLTSSGEGPLVFASCNCDYTADELASHHPNE
jgi:hypothetical protein